MRMAAWILLLYGLYIVVGFIARTLIHLRRTGASPLKRPRARLFSLEWFAAVLVSVGATLGLASPFLDLFNITRPMPALDWPIGHTIGFWLFGIGLATMFWSQMTMGASWRIGVDSKEQTELVTRGIFSFVRNPIYSSGFLMSLGMFLILPVPWMALSVIILILGVEVQVRAVEEPLLRTSHGMKYSDYTAKVGRFVPGVGRIAARSASDGR